MKRIILIMFAICLPYLTFGATISDNIYDYEFGKTVSITNLVLYGNADFKGNGITNCSFGPYITNSIVSGTICDPTNLTNYATIYFFQASQNIQLDSIQGACRVTGVATGNLVQSIGTNLEATADLATGIQFTTTYSSNGPGSFANVYLTNGNWLGWKTTTCTTTQLVLNIVGAHRLW